MLPFLYLIEIDNFFNWVDIFYLFHYNHFIDFSLYIFLSQIFYEFNQNDEIILYSFCWERIKTFILVMFSKINIIYTYKNKGRRPHRLQINVIDHWDLKINSYNYKSTYSKQPCNWAVSESIQRGDGKVLRRRVRGAARGREQLLHTVLTQSTRE